MSGVAYDINDFIEEILHARYGEQVRSAIVNALQWYDNMDVELTILPAGSDPTASIDNTGDHPVLQLGLPDQDLDVATTTETARIISDWSPPSQQLY